MMKVALLNPNPGLGIRVVFLCFVLIGGLNHLAHGGFTKPSELGEDFVTLRQIQFAPVAFLTNEIEVTPEHQQQRPGGHGTGISCSTPGIFVAAPDGCNRCFCGENRELTHQCTRAYCPPGFPSEFGSRRFNRPIQYNQHPL